MSEQEASNSSSAAPVVSDFLLAKKDVTTVADGVHLVGGQGNSVLVETERGLVITDSGPGGKVTRSMIEHVRGISDKPLLAIVYSHGHVGYNHGAKRWLEDAAERGHPKPEIIAQSRLAHRYRRYQETWRLQGHLNGLQFNFQMPEQPPEKWFTFPTIEFDDRYVIEGGDRDIEILAAPSETDDCMARVSSNQFPTSAHRFAPCATRFAGRTPWSDFRRYVRRPLSPSLGSRSTVRRKHGTRCN